MTTSVHASSVWWDRPLPRPRVPHPGAHLDGYFIPQQVAIACGHSREWMSASATVVTEPGVAGEVNAPPGLAAEMCPHPHGGQNDWGVGRVRAGARHARPWRLGGHSQDEQMGQAQGGRSCVPDKSGPDVDTRGYSEVKFM